VPPATLHVLRQTFAVSRMMRTTGWQIKAKSPSGACLKSNAASAARDIVLSSNAQVLFAWERSRTLTRSTSKMKNRSIASSSSWKHGHQDDGNEDQYLLLTAHRWLLSQVSAWFEHVTNPWMSVTCLDTL